MTSSKETATRRRSPGGSLLHSINVDPRDPRHLYIGLSGGGVFESVDGGADWRPLNRGDTGRRPFSCDEID